MKLIALVGIFLFHQLAMADFVYMQEDEMGKSIQWQESKASGPTVLNDQSKNEWAIYPDISPDGKEFVYVEGPSQDDLHLTYVHPEKNISRRFFMSQKGMLLHPKFSKNGQYIFYSAPGPEGKNTIYYFEHDKEVLRQGTNQTTFSLAAAKLLDGSEESYFPRPSSDGNFVVYQRNESGKKSIVLFDRLENTKTVLAEGMSPALSFDERSIAFTSKKEGNWNIYIIDRNTGAITQMTSDAGDEMAPTFRPDGALVFASNKLGHFRLYQLAKDGWLPLLQLQEQDKNKDFYAPQFSGEMGFIQSHKDPFLGKPRSSFGTIAHEGKIYMAGGHQGHEHTYPPESFTDLFLVYDQALGQWKELAPRPVKAHGYQLAAFGNYVYAFGGFAYSERHKPSWKSLNQIDRYNIKENKWETIGRLATPRSSNVAVTIDSKVYLMAGWDSTPKFENDLEGTFLESVEIFDLTNEQISMASYKLPKPLRRALTGISYKGQIVLIGGLGVGSSHFELLNNVTVINPNDGRVTEWAPLPFSTFAPAAEIIDQELFVFGGMFKMGEMSYEYVAHIFGLDLNSFLWRHTGRYLQETKGFSQVFKLNDMTLGILGGHHYEEGNDTPVNTFETFKKKEP